MGLKNLQDLGWGCNSVAESLPSMGETLDLIPSTAQKKGRKKKNFKTFNYKECSLVERVLD